MGVQKRPPHGARHGADARIHEELRQVLLHGLARWRLRGARVGNDDAHLARRVVGEGHGLAGRRVLEGDAVGVQELSAQPQLGPGIAGAVGVVDRVAHDRMARVLHVHADLVGAPGEQFTLDEAVAVVLGASFKALEHAEGGDSLPGARRIAHSHADPEFAP